MTNRTIRTVVRFTSAFSLPDSVTSLPPGDYLVDRDEEAIEGVSRIAWRRVATFLHLPAMSKGMSTQQLVPIDPAVLDAGQEQEHQPS